MSLTGGVQRTSRQLYRDCLRLIQHVAPGRTSPKSVALRQTVRAQFRKHELETDGDVIELCKAKAVRALSNYLLAANAPKDPKVKAAMKDYHDRSVESACNEPRGEAKAN
jgi:Complex 1 protein (LYR family)